MVSSAAASAHAVVAGDRRHNRRDRLGEQFPPPGRVRRVDGLCALLALDVLAGLSDHLGRETVGNEPVHGQAATLGRSMTVKGLVVRTA